jgi:hypothetical protein
MSQRNRSTSDVTTTHITVGPFSQRGGDEDYPLIAQHTSHHQSTNGASHPYTRPHSFSHHPRTKSELDLNHFDTPPFTPPHLALVQWYSLARRRSAWITRRHILLTAGGLLVALLLFAVCFVLYSLPSIPIGPAPFVDFKTLTSQTQLTHLPLLVIIYTCPPAVRTMHDTSARDMARHVVRTITHHAFVCLCLACH